MKKKPYIVPVPKSEMAKFLPNYSEMILGDRALNAFFDNSKLKDAVPGIQFDYDLEKGLEKVLNFYNKEGASAPIDYQYAGQVDRMLRKATGIWSWFCKYDGQAGLKKYWLFSILPFKIAKRLNR